MVASWMYGGLRVLCVCRIDQWIRLRQETKHRDVVFVGEDMIWSM